MHSNFSYYSNGILKGSDEFGVIAVYFGSNSLFGTHDGQTSNISAEKSGNGLNWEMVSQDYSEPMKFTLQLCNFDGSPISQEQERNLNKFLCHRCEYGWFFIDSPEYSDIWIKCVIHNPKVWSTGDRSGLEYTVTTNSAIAFSDEKVHTFSITDSLKKYDLYVYNDENYPVFPIFEITMLEAGDLTITNHTEDNSEVTSIIRNLSIGEKIIVDNEYPDITSSIPTHSAINDFNLIWIKLYDGLNSLTIDKKCNVIIKYREYRKMIIF